MPDGTACGKEFSMFFANIGIAEKYNYLDEKFTAAYRWLRETDLNAIKAGSYPIMEGVTANVQEYDTKAPSEGRFEAHNKFFDIQYIISGREQFGICKREGLKVYSEDPANDLVLYEEPEVSGTVPLLQGDLIVVAPEDAHKPRLHAGKGPEAVRKVVVKVSV
jgi:biofilm protein TabA